MTIDEIKKLIELVQQTGISELEVKFGDDSVRIRSGSAQGNQEITLPAIFPVSMSAATVQPAVPAPAPHVPGIEATQE
jgi:acetyl-CoA carboxylase biotin carboxyl carrier protein